jgi:hypothetical protein
MLGILLVRKPIMTLGEELCHKYALTSLNIGGHHAAILAINEALEVAATIAESRSATGVAERIRELKWWLCQRTRLSRTASGRQEPSVFGHSARRCVSVGRPEMDDSQQSWFTSVE